jgi:hypothetical protein
MTEVVSPPILNKVADVEQSKHDLGSGSVPMPQPKQTRVAVFGQTQSGVSTIVNRLLQKGILPRLAKSQTSCCVVRVRYLSAPMQKPVVFIRSCEGSETRERVEVDDGELMFKVYELLQSVKAKAQESDETVQIVAAEEIIVEFRNPAFHNEEFIDIPGIINTREDINNENLHAIMCRVILEDVGNTLFVAAVKGAPGMTMNNSLTMSLVEKYNLIDRTVGAITMLDKFNWEDDDNIDDLLSGDAGVQQAYPLTHGWFLLASRERRFFSAEQNKLPLQDKFRGPIQSDLLGFLDPVEEEYFRESAPLSHAASVTGIGHLRNAVRNAFSAMLVRNGYFGESVAYCEQNINTSVQQTVPLGTPRFDFPDHTPTQEVLSSLLSHILGLMQSKVAEAEALVFQTCFDLTQPLLEAAQKCSVVTEPLQSLKNMHARRDVAGKIRGAMKDLVGVVNQEDCAGRMSRKVATALVKPVVDDTASPIRAARLSKLIDRLTESLSENIAANVQIDRARKHFKHMRGQVDNFPYLHSGNRQMLESLPEAALAVLLENFAATTNFKKLVNDTLTSLITIENWSDGLFVDTTTAEYERLLLNTKLFCQMGVKLLQELSDSCHVDQEQADVQQTIKWVSDGRKAEIAARKTHLASVQQTARGDLQTLCDYQERVSTQPHALTSVSLRTTTDGTAAAN